jgi:small multidrug resistance pump
MWFYLSLLLGILLGVAGQFLLKAGADGESLSAQYFSPEPILGLVLYAAAALCYMFALREIPVSVAFPSVSISYILVVGIAYWRYDEPLGWSKLTGVLLICAGVALVARQA